METASLHRDQVVEITRTWLGTPYRHQASLKGAGCDCLGLLRGVWEEITGEKAEASSRYKPDWSEKREKGTDLFLRKALKYLQEVSIDNLAPGDVLIFRMQRDRAAKHCAIMSHNGYMIHAISGRNVAEVTLSPLFKQRIVGVFRFPGVK